MADQHCHRDRNAHLQGSADEHVLGGRGKFVEGKLNSNRKEQEQAAELREEIDRLRAGVSVVDSFFKFFLFFNRLLD